MMKDILWLIKKTLNVTFRKRRNIIIYFGLPLIGIFISFLAYGGSNEQTLKVGVINHDQESISVDTVQFLKELKNVKATTTNESAMKEKLASGNLDCVIILDNGFSESVYNGQPDHIQIVSIKGAQITSFVKSYLYEYLDSVMAISKAAGGNKETFDKMYGSYQKESFHVSTKTLKDSSKNKNMTYQTIGFLLMIMLISAGNFAEIILKEKENRTYFRLLSTPINARQYVLSNIAVSFMVMMVQIIFTLIFMTKVVHIDMHIPFWQMTLILLVFALVAIGLSLMIISFSTNSASASSLQNLVTTPTCLLAGCFWPVEIMPKAAQKVADFMPQRWTLDIITKLQEGSHLGSLYLHFMILIAFAVAFFLIATYKFGKNNQIRNFV